MKKYICEKSQNRDKLIQSRTPGQPTKNRDRWNVCVLYHKSNDEFHRKDIRKNAWTKVAYQVGNPLE